MRMGIQETRRSSLGLKVKQDDIKWTGLVKSSKDDQKRRRIVLKKNVRREWKLHGFE